MVLKLAKTIDDERTLEKSLFGETEFTGTLKIGCDVLRPVIVVKGDVVELSSYNYATIELLKRRYFVRGCTVLANRLCELSLEVDVLGSYAETLIECSGRVVRSENPERYKLQKITKDTNSTKTIAFENPFNFEGVNVMVTVNGSRA